MGRAPAEKITAQTLRKLASRLRKCSDELKGIAQAMESKQFQALLITNAPTMRTGITFVESFVSAADRALNEAIHPLDED